jgi:hypothetical protein
MDSNAAAARMLSHSDDFFKSYPVMMAGGTGAWAPNAMNPKTYYLAKKNPGIGGNADGSGKEGHYGATRRGFLHTKNISSFTMLPNGGAGSSAPLATHGVPMVNYNSNLDGKINLLGNTTAMAHFVVGAGANYMTTGLLTGCCFAWVAIAGGLWCTHIRPDGPIGPTIPKMIDGATLQDRLALHGRFAAAPGQMLSTFGRNNYGGSYAIVIGVNTPGGWKLYAQTSMDNFRTITNAWRLHPGTMTRL